MRERRMALGLVLAVLVTSLAGCAGLTVGTDAPGGGVTVSDLDLPPAPEPEPAPEPVPEPEPEQEPEPEPEPAPEPEPEVTGEKLVVDGQELAVVRLEDREYIPRDALEAALGREVVPEGAALADAEYLPYPEAVEGLGLPTLADPENDTVYVSPSAEYTVPEGYKVPVLMYHAVGDKPWGIEDLFVRPSELEEQLQFLTDNGYDPIWFSDLGHIGDYDKPVILTFDDGYDDNYLELYPLLQKYNAKATVFVITGKVGQTHYMTAEQIRELADSGLVSIQSHTVDHYELEDLGEEDTVYQLEQSRLDIARLTGRIPTVLCYPSGSNSKLTRTVAASCYKLGIKMRGGLWKTSSDPFQVNRYYVPRGHDLSSFAAQVERAGT